MNDAPPPLRVLVDDQAFMYLPRSGMARYFAALISELRAHPQWGVHPVTPFRYVRSEHLADIDAGAYTATGLAHRALMGRGARALRLANRVRVPRRGRVDLVHHTFYAPGALRAHAAARRVCTIFDMIPERYPDASLAGQARDKRAYVAACDGLVCISDATRREFLRIYGDPGVPLHVTPLAVSPVFFGAGRDAGPAATPLPEPYLLYVGQRGRYKNFAVLLQAYAALAAARHLHLVCVGGQPFAPAEEERIAAVCDPSRVVRLDLDDGGLAAAYRRAAAFVFPSEIEGFGLPVLEALAARCPAVLADIPIFREIADTAATFFPPRDADALASVLERALTPPPPAALDAGERRAAGFTWERTARQSAAFYREVMAA